ncbi:MAG: HAD family hydrolase [Bacillota bacterium]
MIRAIFFDVRSLFYGPQGAELLTEILRAEGIGVEQAEVEDGLLRLPAELKQARTQIRTEEQENDYHRAMIPELLRNVGVPFPTDALLLRILEAVHQYSAWWSLYPETLPVLEELKRRGFTLGVVANWEPSLRRFLAEFEVEGYFGPVLSSMEAGVAKPDPILFHRAVKEAGVRSAEVLHAGPSISEDVAGALSAGLTPVWINRTGISTGHEVLTIEDLRGLLMLAQKAGE